jgi:hypothetical protein
VRHYTSIEIPGSVTNIGNFAFQDCTKLSDVTFSNGVTTIGVDAFAFCTSLTNITIPASVTNIEGVAFAGCTSMTAITVDTNNPAFSSLNGVLFNKSQSTLVEYPAGVGGSYAVPDSVTNIGDQAFMLTALTGISIPNSVASIAAGAFVATPLTSIAIPIGVTSINDNTFFQCSSLTNVTIPDGVTNIEENAFTFCSGLNSLTIPSSVDNIDDLSFVSCNCLTNVYFTGNAPIAGSKVFYGDANTTVYYLPGTTGWGPTFGGVPTELWIPFTYTTNADAIIITGYTGPGGAVTIPCIINGLPVVGIGGNAFAGTFFDPNTNVTCVTIPGTVTAIGEYAFYSCIGLTNVTIPYGVTSIGPYAFNQCSGLPILVIPDSVTNIGAYAFFGCFALTGSLTIPDSVIAIGAGAFGGCRGLISVTIGANVTSIGDYAFSTGGALAAAYFKGNAPISDLKVFGDDIATMYYLPGTTGWSQMFDGLPAEAWNPQIQTGDGSFGVKNNQFGFNITGTANLAVVVEGCTNLASRVWVPIQTVSLTNGSAFFSDAQRSNYPCRFYCLCFP